ncbi:cytochrome P450 [Ceratobasidium sp. AG-I]|nr:cytochrome P450 [Ceratobasidium sp. AG-I]
MLDYATSVSLGTLSIGLLAYKLWEMQTSRKVQLPPSPKAFPLVGHLFSMPAESEHLGYIEIGKQLGSNILSLTTFGTTVVVLNSAEDAINLLEKRSAIYSDRVCPPMIGEPSLMNWTGFASLVGYNDRWRKYRRLMNPWLHKKASDNFRPSQTREARLLLRRLLDKHEEYDSSEDLANEVYRSIAATVLRSVYGYQLKSLDDPFLVEAKIAVDNIMKAWLASNFMVNAVPALVHVPDWFPGTSWKKTAREWRKQKEDVVQATYHWAKARHTNDVDERCIIDAMIDQAPSLGLSEAEADDYIQEIAITLLSGGTDTTANTLLNFFVAMMLFPEVKAKAQREIDEVIGSDRLPNLDDQERLPYVNRVVQELLRWLPVTPLAAPHTCFQDDVYRGYHIPKGAIIFGNVWAMTRDTAVYSNPEDFNPDRFLDPSVPPSPLFGWGRRRCPGVHFGQASLFITIATFLATFDIIMAKDEDGRDIIPSTKIGNSIVAKIVPFKYRLTPRSEAHKTLIRATI